MTTALSPDRIMQLGFGYWGSKALLSAVELGLFTSLAAKGPMNADAVTRELKLHPRSVRDFLDALVALGMLQRDAAGRYDNTPETAAFLDKRKPEYMGGMLEMSSFRLYNFWGSLTEALRTGLPQNESKTGGNLFDAIYQSPERLKSFLEGMTGLSLPMAKAIATKFPWAKCKTFVDIGCAQGAVPVELAKAHPHLTGAGFDLPVVKATFEEYVARHKLTDRVRFLTGNFFDDPLPSADALIMGHILHDWNMDEKMMLLQKAFDALPKGGSLIVYEAIIDDERRRNAFGLLMSVNMLIETSGGFDYTGADCQGWMRDVGFSATRVEHLAGPDSMVVGVK